MSALPPPPPPPPPPALPGQPPPFAHARVRAQFGARLGGYLLDGLLYGLLLGVFIAGGIIIMAAAAKDCLDRIDFENDTTVNCTSDEVNAGLLMLGIVVIAIGIMLVLFIYARSLGKTGQTWGRKIVGIRVVDKFTELPIGFGRALGRTVFANLISSSFMYLGYLWMLWDTDQQTWHDKVVGSIVVRD
jgi:uncharacterized RDD family membrane protein YckC